MRVAVLPDQQRRGRDLGMPELTLLLLSQPVVGFNLRARFVVADGVFVGGIHASVSPSFSISPNYFLVFCFCAQNLHYLKAPPVFSPQIPLSLPFSRSSLPLFLFPSLPLFLMQRKVETIEFLSNFQL